MEGIKPYEKYKDSGIPWLGLIPEQWQVRKLKYSLKINNGADYKHIQCENGYPVIGSGGQFAFANDFMFDGEVVFLGRKGTIDKPLYFKGKFWAVDTMFYANSKRGNSVKFHFYVSTQIPFKLYSTSTALPSMTQSDLKEHYLAYPSINEQTAIANFLDYKTAKIDRFIFKKKQLIKLLNEQKAVIINNAVTKGLNPNAKMKPSEVKWLGDIPEQWEVRKLKGICNAFGRIGFRGYKTTDLVNQGEGAITISPSNMKYNFMTFDKCTYLNWGKYEESPEIKIFNEDIIMVKTGSTYGKVGIVKNLDQEATINPQLLVLKNIKINPDYLYFLLKSNFVQSQVKTEVIGSTIPTISQTKILNFNIVTPPEFEIENILIYIEKETSIINKIIATIEKEIALVQEYRTALIAEAVTGKIDVREYKVPSFEVDKEYAEMEEEVGLVAEDGEEID